ncbi:MAG: GMC oxidoreductase [Pseudomonadota bacterium]
MTDQDNTLDAVTSRTTDDVLDASGGFDAIVVGAGAAGGLAAMLLTQGGLKVLVLDAGWRPGFLRAPLRTMTAAAVQALTNPALQRVLPARLIHMGDRALRLVGRARQPVQSRCFAWGMAPAAFVDDRDHPYVANGDHPFKWFRVQQLGGRLTVPGHGRQYYRLGDSVFQPPDNETARWPYGAEDLNPWYDAVEELIEIEAAHDGCPHVPDSNPAIVRTPLGWEAEVIDAVKSEFPAAHAIVGRSAAPPETLSKAAQTGRLYCRKGAIGATVEQHKDGRVSGVTWYDRANGRMRSAEAPLVFLCASTLESTRIMLASGRDRRNGGPGAQSGLLGTHLMDHVLLSGVGEGGPLPDEPIENIPGRCVYLPRFDLRSTVQPTVGSDTAMPGTPVTTGSKDGFSVQVHRWSTRPGRSHFVAVSFSEMQPRRENHVRLHPTRTDKFGLPVLDIHIDHSEQERTKAQTQSEAIADVGRLFGIDFHRLDAEPAPAGTALHECGTARMGDRPENSVLDGYAQCWDAPGLYVSDGAALPSQGLEHPTLTIMAVTARACAHALNGMIEVNTPIERNEALQRLVDTA